MGKLAFSLILMLLLVSVWCSYSHPAHADSDALRELLELLRSGSSVVRQPVEDAELEVSPDELWPDSEAVEKRDLPRLGVSIYRPQMSRVHSSKSMDASKYRLSDPAERMARLHG